MGFRVKAQGGVSGPSFLCVDIDLLCWILEPIDLWTSCSHQEDVQTPSDFSLTDPQVTPACPHLEASRGLVVSAHLCLSWCPPCQSGSGEPQRAVSGASYRHLQPFSLACCSSSSAGGQSLYFPGATQEVRQATSALRSLGSSGGFVKPCPTFNIGTWDIGHGTWLRAPFSGSPSSLAVFATFLLFSIKPRESSLLG